ncbi:MAG: hypothetical protein ACRC4T_21815 [Cetobacterium sp.]
MRGISFKFGKVIVNVDGSIVNIEIPDDMSIKNFESKYLESLKKKYSKFIFKISGPKNLICTNKGNLKILNNKTEMIGSKTSTISTLVKIRKEFFKENIKYELFFNNFHNPTGFKAEYISNTEIEFELYEKYILNGFFVNSQRELKDYEKSMKYIPTYFKINKIKKVKDSDIEIYNKFDEHDIKRTPLTCFSKFSKGFLDSSKIELMINEKKISNCCFTDRNTNLWVENQNFNQPLALEFWVENDICPDDKNIYSMSLFVNKEDSYIRYYDDAIKVNEGVRAVNEMITNSSKYKDEPLFKLSEVLKYKKLGYFKLGSFNRDGFIYKNLYNGDYHILNRYCDEIDFYGIEPFDNLYYLIYEREDCSYKKLEFINRRIFKLAKLRNKKVVFSENAVIGYESEREIIKNYHISKYIKDNELKDKKDIEKISCNFPKNRISYIRSLDEAWLELNNQGFSDEEVLEILINEKEIFESFIYKKSITVIPETLLTSKSDKVKEEVKIFCLKRVVEIYGKNPPAEVMQRLKEELTIIFKNNYEVLFLLSAILAKRTYDRGFMTGGRGTAGNLLVTYLLKVSDINPLDYNLDYRMFFGPNMEKVPDLDINVPKEIIKDVVAELIESYKNGLIKASVNNFMKEDGLKSMVFSKVPGITEKIDIDYATNMLEGLYQRTQPHNSGVLILPGVIDTNYIFPTIEYNNERIPAYDYHKLDKVLIKLDILSKNHLDTIKTLNEVTDIEKINYNDENVLNMINELKTDGIPEMNTDNMKKIISIVKPKNFDDLVRIQGLAHGKGVFRNNADILISKGEKYISSREDLLELLVEYKVENSFMIMEKIRKGNYNKLTQEELQELNKLPEIWQQSISKIQYLFPKAHALSYAKTSYLIALYIRYQNSIEKKRNQVKSDKVTDSIDNIIENYGAC